MRSNIILCFLSFSISALAQEQLYENRTDSSALANAGFSVFHLSDNANLNYPIITSPTKPRVASAINKALQISDSRVTNTTKNPKALATKLAGQIWTYNVMMPTDRLIIVAGKEAVPDRTRRDWAAVFHYHRAYFDAITGDRVYLRDLFLPNGFSLLGFMALTDFEKAALQSETKDKEGCKKYIKTTWNEGDLMFSVDNISKDFVFEMDDCASKVPGTEFLNFTSRQPWDFVRQQLSPLGKYYFDGGPKQQPETMTHTWTGKLGDNIPVTFFIKMWPDGTLEGNEVYDNFGTPIRLDGLYAGGKMNLAEMDESGRIIIATYDLTYKDRTLSGTWTNAAGTKSLNFFAKVAAE